MNLKSFYTIFPETYNVHLIKDVGMIPYLMYKNHGYKSTIATFQNDNYAYIENEAKGLNIEYIKKRNWPKGSNIIDPMLFLWEKAKKINVLHLFHNTLRTFIWGIIYKYRNPDGLLYIKLDTSVYYMEKMNENRMVKYIKSYFFNHFADIISYECHNIKDLFIGKYTIKDDKKLIYVPNGMKYSLIEPVIRQNKPKENFFITVGRIGHKSKNNEMLLNVLDEVNLKDWNVVFIGPIEEEFQTYIDRFFHKHPQLADKVFFTGNITDRTVLYDWYNRSKVFCFTSIMESFGIVLVEAEFFGNFIISTDISSIDDITGNGQYGFIVHHQKELAEKMQYAIDHPDWLMKQAASVKQYARENFDWDQIVERLDSFICPHGK